MKVKVETHSDPGIVRRSSSAVRPLSSVVGRLLSAVSPSSYVSRRLAIFRHRQPSASPAAPPRDEPRRSPATAGRRRAPTVHRPTVPPPSPYGKWTDDMVAILGKEQTMTFIFYYQ